MSGRASCRRCEQRVPSVGLAWHGSVVEVEVNCYSCDTGVVDILDKLASWEQVARHVFENRSFQRRWKCRSEAEVHGSIVGCVVERAWTAQRAVELVDVVQR